MEQVEQVKTESRTGWLQRILGPHQAKQVEEQLLATRVEVGTATAVLDAAGLQRKAVSDTPPEQAAPEDVEAVEDIAEADAVLKVAQTLAAEIKAGVGGDYSQLTDEGLTAALADALSAAMPPDPLDGDVTEEDNQEIQMDDNEKSMSEATKAITDTLGSMVKDMGDLAALNIAQAAEIKELKSLKPAVDQLVADIGVLKAALAQRPRAASEADETEPNLSEEERKVLEKAIKKGLQGPKMMYMGRVPVTEEPK